MVYFGCTTWPNRARWLLVVAFCCLGVVLTVLHAMETAQCVRCTTSPDGVEVCEDYEQGRDVDWSGLKRCRMWWVIASAALFMACFTLCTLSCICMCFAKAPGDEHMTVPLSISQGDSSLNPIRKGNLHVKTKAARGSTSRIALRQSTPGSRTPLTPPSAATQKSGATPTAAHGAPASQNPTHFVQLSPPRPVSAAAPAAAAAAGTRTAPAASAKTPRQSSSAAPSPAVSPAGDNYLAGKGLLGLDEVWAAAEAGGGPVRTGSSAARARAAISAKAPADAVGESVAQRQPSGASESARASMHASAHDPITPIDRQSTVRPSPYVVLDSEGSYSAHSMHSMSSSRPYVTNYTNAQELLALEPAAVSGGPGRNAGDVLRSLEQLSYAGKTDTYGSQMLGPVPDRWFMLKPSASRHSMRSALTAYAAAQEAGEEGGLGPGVPNGTASSMRMARALSTDCSIGRSPSADSLAYGAASPASVTLEGVVPGAEMLAEISLQLSGIADTDAIVDAEA